MVAPEVVKAMEPYFSEHYGNPSSMHEFGGQNRGVIEEARHFVAELLGASDSEIIFTSCGTESDNAAISSAITTMLPRKKILVSKVEHPAVLNVGKELSRRNFNVIEIPVDSNGRIDIEFIEKNTDHDTALVSVMWANNEIGNIYPVEKIAEIAHRKGALFHTDAVQAVGKIPVKLQSINIDMLSMSGHKLHAPKGIGALYIRRGVRFKPYIVGGHQEGGRRAGTENTAFIVGLGIACKLAADKMATTDKYVRDLRDRLEAKILSSVPSVRVNGDIESRVPNTTNISFEFIEGESILLMLNRLGICASSGSACTSGSLEPSHVLRAIGVPYTAAHGSIRFSFSSYNTVEEVDLIAEKVPSIIKTLREMSPYWKQKKNASKG
jgi:cysteine desulfurase